MVLWTQLDAGPRITTDRYRILMTIYLHIFTGTGARCNTILPKSGFAPRHRHRPSEELDKELFGDSDSDSDVEEEVEEMTILDDDLGILEKQSRPLRYMQ